MYKASPVPVMDCHVALYRREIQDQILVSFIAAKKPEDIGDYLPITPSSVDSEWTDLACRAEVDIEAIMDEARRENEAAADLPDDGLPRAYPTVHFGESIYSAMLGGRIRFVGTPAHTCSGAGPFLTDWGHQWAKDRLGRLFGGPERAALYLRIVRDSSRDVAARGKLIDEAQSVVNDPKLWPRALPYWQDLAEEMRYRLRLLETLNARDKAKEP